MSQWDTGRTWFRRGVATAAAFALATSGLVVAGTTGASAHPRVPNPYAGATPYVNPEWSAEATAGGGGPIADQPTAVWLDSMSAVLSADGNTMSLVHHLEEAVAQGADLIQLVIYNLPGRDCSALESDGELGPNDLDVYEQEYIDNIAFILDQPQFADLRIVTVIETNSLANLVTNVGVVGDDSPATHLCNEMLANGNYIEGVGYALATLGAIPNVYNYVDIGHHGWLGWDDNFQPFADLVAQAANANGATPDDVHGFVSNVANYAASVEPFFDVDDVVAGTPIRHVPVTDGGWISFNNYIDEVSYVQAYRPVLTAALGKYRPVSMLIDTSRNGWGGPERPTGTSTSTDPVTYMDESRIDRRIHQGNWCNQADAGLGERPTANPEPHVHAYVWIKPPGESDGISAPTIPGGLKSDPMCDPDYEGDARNQFLPTGALPNAPPRGHWFQAQFDELLAYAHPPL